MLYAIIEKYILKTNISPSSLKLLETSQGVENCKKLGQDNSRKYFFTFVYRLLY